MNNDKRVNDVLNTGDDTWKLVAADPSSKRYAVDDVIENWVGFGDTSDVFRVFTDENGQLVFSGNNEDTMDALASKEITLSLVDVNGKKVSLVFDKVSGSYTSKNILRADAEYFLTVKSAKPKSQNTDFQIAIDLK